MAPAVNAGFNQTLQSYDIEAVSSLYGAGPPCNIPVVTNVRGGGTVASGQSATLVVDVTGTTPFTFQWYRGNKGDRTQPVSGATLQQFTTPPVTTTQSYWALV